MPTIEETEIYIFIYTDDNLNRVLKLNDKLKKLALLDELNA